ncbi:MAG: putative toxin-antitoxin system toxin component, PIN family [Lentimicrobiaceae bacterium]|nr:putative toxin-antitoxin system toxin component, PIN family [Lentimicrobiaceae bacterium]
MESRTVFDTNVLVSHAITGRFYDLAKTAISHDVVFLRSLPLIAEIKEVLSRKKFDKYDVDLDEFIDMFLDISEFCYTIPKFTACPDPKDNFLFDLALQGNAKYLVSGDKKVLSTSAGSETLKVTTLPAFKEYLQIY